MRPAGPQSGGKRTAPKSLLNSSIHFKRSSVSDLPNFDSDREERASVVKLRCSGLVDQVEMPGSF